MGSFSGLGDLFSIGPIKQIPKRSQRGPVSDEKNLKGRGVEVSCTNIIKPIKKIKA